MTTYLEVVGAVNDYYGTDSDIWYKVATSGGANLSPSEISQLRSVPGVSVTVGNDGSFRGWDYNNPFPQTNNPVSAVDSNVPNSSYGGSSFNGRVNGTYHWDGATQTGRLTSGARNVSTGARVATVAGKINTAVMAVSAGMFLGAKIDSTLYNVGKFFDLNPPESLNPATWDSIATTDQGKQLIRTLFHIDDNGSTMYVPEDAIGYMYNYWNSLSAFSEGSISAQYTPSSGVDISGIPQPVSMASPSTHVTIQSGTRYREFYYENAEYLVFYTNPSSGIMSATAISRTTPPTVYYRTGSGTSFAPHTGGTRTTIGRGTTYYYNDYVSMQTSMFTNWSTHGLPDNTVTTSSSPASKIGTIVIDGTVTTVSPTPGINPDPNASEHVNPSQIDPSQPILPQLKQQLPNTFNNPIKESVPQPDGTNKDIIYYPAPWPKIGTDTDKPVSGTPTQDDPIVQITDPTDETDPLRDVITNPFPQPETPTPGPAATPPSTGGGSSPTVTQPTGEASSLWAVYNPTQAQLDAFGAWLWSSNFVDQIKKLFNDPMQAIVGVHKVFATPSTGSQVNIKCGYIDSECPAAKVTSQYTTVDCGTVNVREYYGNVLDYAPYTEISLYLPFIGIVKLDVADVMRGSVQVKYHVDVITGACLADVIVKRDGESAVLYQYAGSAIVTYPVSSGSYASMVTGVLSLAAGVAGTIMTGGAAAPALIGGAVGLSHLHTDVQKSGGFSGSAGAMGGKKPYLIISRPQDATPENFEKYEGKPASKTVVLGNCSGFVKVKQINIDAVPATYGEQDQIVALLKQGIIL